ncbi:RNA polymerase sigma-70 factor (ECF subfamily) [Nocardia transvalensis]|uniref:RNA polymerase sigma-70 factor (ECF subfamily) n=1 Tax=Nocardia transvalensis TaxID=37333 RepID=A0A7W9PD47_9NOCA|nr:RNA polymerase sigma factor SigJ [Nocardia transvalensis]MBB5913765.1 RNA polymerase sigma-70 factor (ECF subfamily) [Nocardia transvalensis]
MEFEHHRPELFAAAYRMLGSRTEAEDVLQEAWLRWREVDHDTVERPRAYLFRLVSRLAIDQLRKAKARRETYIGPWLPEPLLTGPETDAERAESVSMALLVVLESLDPAERVVFVLHEVFGVGHAEIAEVLGRTERATRQLGYRARQHVEARRPRHRPTGRDHRELTDRFLTAAAGGDLTALTRLLAPDVVFCADADGASETPREPVLGLTAVAGYLCSVTWAWPADLAWRPAEVNAGPGAVLTARGAVYAVLSLDTDGDNRIRTVRLILEPGKLRHITQHL